MAVNKNTKCRLWPRSMNIGRYPLPWTTVGALRPEDFRTGDWPSPRVELASVEVYDNARSEKEWTVTALLRAVGTTQ